MHPKIYPNPLKQFFSLERLLLITIIIGVLMRSLNLGSREFWYDEILSLLLSTGQKIDYTNPGDSPVVLANYSALLHLPREFSISDRIATVRNLLRGIVGGEPHPPLFYLSQHLWLRLFGNSAIALRSLNALLSCAAIGCAYGFARFQFNHRTGLLFAALLAINPFYLFHSLNVRMYAPLVLWTMLSAWSLLKIIHIQQNKTDKNLPEKLDFLADQINTGNQARKHNFFAKIWLSLQKNFFFWSFLLVTSLAVGCLTFYLFFYWLITLSLVSLYRDFRRWWFYSLHFAMSIFLTLPWMLWGIPQQLRNADIQRFDAMPGIVAATLQHLQDVFQTLGSQLLLGDWVTSLPESSGAIAGIAVIVFLIFCVMQTCKMTTPHLGGLVFILGIFPLIFALLIDTITGKFTLGFGAGRSMIFILPGCLLLLAIGLQKKYQRLNVPHPKNYLIVSLILLYLTLGISDYTLRKRQVFHQISAIVATEPQRETLIVMNSNAWGHVLRLAYYIPPKLPVQLLANSSEELAANLATTLKNQSGEIQRILWLESLKPVWSPPTTVEQRSIIQKLFSDRYSLAQTLSLNGTMSLDQFVLKIYTRSPERN